MRQQTLVIPALIAVLLILACGSFAPRPTRTPRAITPMGLTQATATPEATQDTPTSLPELPTLAPTPSPTSTFTPTPPPGMALMSGQPARVVAAGGLNVRQQPGMDQPRIGKLAPGALVQVLEGPVQGTGYRWWRVQDRRGLEGWVAEGNGEEQWLSPQIGEPRPVSRPVVRGDEVVVTTQKGNVLTVRFEAGLDSVVARRLRAGARLKVVDGPVDVDGYRWWQVEDQEGRRGWAAEGDQETRWLTPIE
ncbi:MAG: SH3 domain-containing protein [Anaerolineae bacterium]|nr:SH3 domain-containing protein [Anaerolineae bacterium]MDW8098741.1 SH3 domain-containing protein [Anaerolineae bacterium]